MRFIQEEEAKECFPELIEAVASGESIAIIRNGIKVAALVPTEETHLFSEEERERRREGVEKFLEWKRTRKPTGITWEEAMEWRYARE